MNIDAILMYEVFYAPVWFWLIAWFFSCGVFTTGLALAKHVIAPAVRFLARGLLTLIGRPVDDFYRY